MRVSLNIAMGVVLSLLVAQPVFARTGMSLAGGSDLSLIAVALVGVVLGMRGGRKPLTA